MSTRTKTRPVDPRTLTADDHALIAAIVEDIRMGEGYGGQCGFVAEWLANHYGWDMLGGIYFSADGHPIGDHVWNYDPATGLRVDATADQFGEGAAVRIFAETDETGQRYRHAESDEQEEQWLDAARSRDRRLGDYWWGPEGPKSADVLAYEANVRRWETGEEQ